MTLPTPSTPKGNYVPCVQCGDLLYLGTLPVTTRHSRQQPMKKLTHDHLCVQLDICPSRKMGRVSKGKWAKT